MRVYRIERKKYLDVTLKGIGAARTEGYRWNSLNTYLVYTAESRALATLEVSVHLDLNADLPNDRYYVEINIPNTIKILEFKLGDLPKNWNSKPPILLTQFIVTSNKYAVLKVPSAIVPPEHNYLINPNHKDASKIKVVSKELMLFDNRILPVQKPD